MSNSVVFHWNNSFMLTNAERLINKQTNKQSVLYSTLQYSTVEYREVFNYNLCSAVKLIVIKCSICTAVMYDMVQYCNSAM